MFQCHSPKSSLPLPLPQSPKDCSIHLCLFCCLTYISCLTTSNLPWFIDLTFQVPMQYYSLQHWTLLPSPVMSTTKCCFCFSSICSFFLEIFLHWSPVAYWAPTELWSSSFSVLSFCFFILFVGFSSKNAEVVCHCLLHWTPFCQTSPPWAVYLGWPYMTWFVVHCVRQGCGLCDHFD